jgi:glucose-6-phosphate 1-epimerase
MRPPFVRGTLPSSVRLERGAGDLPCLRIANARAKAELYLHGAHLTAWQPAGHDPVLWVSRDSLFDRAKPIRGGIPICFPWFGAHASEPQAPAHGYARLADWSLVDAEDTRDGTTVVLSLGSGDVSWPAWPHAFQATYRVEVGLTLAISLEVRNTGDAPFTFEEALHTYYSVRDVRHVTIAGLEETEYLDKVAGMARARQGGEPMDFTGETDRIFLNTQAACTIHDPGLRRRIVVAKSGSNTTVVWNPWIAKARAMPDFADDEWPGMVCVETCNVNPHAVSLPPQGQHLMSATIRADAR